MQAGELTSQVTLKRKATTRDAMGGEVITYPTAATVSAKAEPIRAPIRFLQYEALSMMHSEAEIRFTIYYREDVTADWRVTWRGRDYEVLGTPIDVNARKEWIELMCRTAQS